MPNSILSQIADDPDIAPEFKRGCAMVLQSAEQAPRIATVRVTIDGEVVGVFEREAFLSKNLDGLSDHDILELRSGRGIEVGGGAAPLVLIEPVAP